ncbi:MAG: hypothetical protein NVSMB6_18470 [Burkholderiaceae bacterium]
MGRGPRRAVRRQMSASRATLYATGLVFSLWTYREACGTEAPLPLLSTGHPVDWWFVYKFNAQTFPVCTTEVEREAKLACPFGGTSASYKHSQSFAVASSDDPELKLASGCAGTLRDPVGATFGQIYNSQFRYVVWNDQFYRDPSVPACKSDSCGGSWGHSKGILAWDDAGEGVIMQVTTPSWPGSASSKFERQSGNTLGCMTKPNNVQNAQHFFALRLQKDDVVAVLKGLANSSVVTNIGDLQLVNTGGPQEIKAVVSALGKKSVSEKVMQTRLSNGVTMFSKPSGLHAPPWQVLSSVLHGIDLRTATWWSSPQIPSTTADTKIRCWSRALAERPGKVEVAITGRWGSKDIGLIGGQNHAKIGVSLSGEHKYVVFADLNQQGTLNGGNCASSQNGRGGLFFVLENDRLHEGVSALINGKTAPSSPQPLNAVILGVPR